MVIVRIQFLAIVGWRPSALRGHLVFSVIWPSSRHAYWPLQIQQERLSHHFCHITQLIQGRNCSIMFTGLTLKWKNFTGCVYIGMEILDAILDSRLPYSLPALIMGMGLPGRSMPWEVPCMLPALDFSMVFLRKQHKSAIPYWDVGKHGLTYRALWDEKTWKIIDSF